MAYVVTDNCVDCRFTQCVAVCPVQCFHADETMVYIDPDNCIDCAGCVEACPVGAIDDEFNLPDDQRYWIEKNRERAAILPRLTGTMDPLPGAEARKAALGL
ncbi:4Fe-4S dicluster domain-containing protein [Sphingobium terrigena]|uniref:Ferredoxin n=1 Tax=Sphingobium terrigena TaxID=2304063 RepID=A0A418YL85_9SPHN|nr:ferredoxin family protein [Sphingobium terrigena]RJG51736.1 4Fe-4S dicluster domain-containing protein [Sphingobium terrigena]